MVSKTDRYGLGAALLFLSTCDLIKGPNPADCVLNQSLCDATQICNVYTHACQERFRFVLGQPSPITSPLAGGMARPGGVVFTEDGGLYVSDSGNNRVLGWLRSESWQSGQLPDVVLGQADSDVDLQAALSTNLANYGGTGSYTLNNPRALAYDKASKRLIIADHDNHRLVIWSGRPSRSRKPVIWGQSDPTYGAPNGSTPGVRLDAYRVDGPEVAVEKQNLYVSDSGNHRVLVFTSIPQDFSIDARFILGQAAKNEGEPDAGGAVSASGLRAPSGQPFVTGDQIFAADTGNHRVLRWSYAGLKAGQSSAANLILGQPDAVSHDANAGGLASDGAKVLSAPSGLGGNASTLWVSDAGNHRVLGWKLASLTANFVSADMVIGQASFGDLELRRPPGPALQTLAAPSAVAVNDRYLAVADTLNHRVLVFDITQPYPEWTQRPVVLGQPGPYDSAPNTPRAAAATILGAPVALSRAGEKFVVCDQSHNRVLIWPRLPQSGQELPTVVLGQTDFGGYLPQGGQSWPGGAGFNRPTAVHSDGRALAVADQQNHRVLLWWDLPVASNQAADVVLGQPDFHTTALSTTPSAGSLNQPSGVYLSGGRLYVADTGNNRVLVWKLTDDNGVPLASGAQAYRVLGQRAMSTTAGGSGATQLAGPAGLHLYGGMLLVADTQNNRVLMFSASPEADGQAALRVIGQSSLTGGTAAATAADTLRLPRAVYVHEGEDGPQLFVADSGNHRVLYWDGIPTRDGQSASGVVGQSSFDGGLPNRGGVSGQTLHDPVGLLSTRDELFIADSTNGRVLVVSRPFFTAPAFATPVSPASLRGRPPR